MLSLLAIVVAAAPAMVALDAAGVARPDPDPQQVVSRAGGETAPSTREAAVRSDTTRSEPALSRTAPTRRPSSRECAAVEVVRPAGDRSGAASREPGRRQSRISAATTIDLQLQVRIRAVLRDDHVLRLELLTPRGYLYQTMTLPFRFATGSEVQVARGEAATRSIAGFPHPLDVQLLSVPTRRRPVADRVTARLPVAGTSIALGSLFGEWTAVPYLDDQSAPCGPAASFVIAE
jgi:hypothetical protein